jgi:hypothetical protein
MMLSMAKSYEHCIGEWEERDTSDSRTRTEKSHSKTKTGSAGWMWLKNNVPSTRGYFCRRYFVQTKQGSLYLYDNPMHAQKRYSPVDTYDICGLRSDNTRKFDFLDAIGAAHQGYKVEADARSCCGRIVTLIICVDHQGTFDAWVGAMQFAVTHRKMWQLYILNVMAEMQREGCRSDNYITLKQRLQTKLGREMSKRERKGVTQALERKYELHGGMSRSVAPEEDTWSRDSVSVELSPVMDVCRSFEKDQTTYTGDNSSARYGWSDNRSFSMV